MRVLALLSFLCGSVSICYSQENVTAECLEKITKIISSDEYKFYKLSDSAKNKILQTTEDVTNLNFPKINKDGILNNISDDNLRRGFSKALNAMEDFFFITEYFAKLEGDTLLKQKRSTKAVLKEMAEDGRLDHDSMVSVLKKRMKDRGLKLVKINDALDESEFQKKIAKGAIIDFGFSASSSHGIYTHLVQQDMIYDIIAKEVDGDYNKILKFLGSSKGLNVWNKMFDSFSSNLTEPEWFKDTILRPFLNLTIVVKKTNNHIA